MTLPITERLPLEAILTHYCDKRVPPHVRDKVQLSFRIEGNIVTLFEKRAAFRDPSRWIDIGVARFHYYKNRNQWVLYWRDSKRRQGWHLYDEIKPNRSIEPLLAEVDRDPTGIFWG